MDSAAHARTSGLGPEPTPQWLRIAKFWGGCGLSGPYYPSVICFWLVLTRVAIGFSCACVHIRARTRTHPPMVENSQNFRGDVASGAHCTLLYSFLGWFSPGWRLDSAAHAHIRAWTRTHHPVVENSQNFGGMWPLGPILPFCHPFLVGSHPGGHWIQLRMRAHQGWDQKAPPSGRK